MNARTRHAAELAARLQRLTDGAYYPLHRRRPSDVAQDVDKLIWLSASLKRVAEKGGPGVITRHERRLSQVITDTLKPYGLTWTHVTEPGISPVHIMFESHKGFAV